MTREPTRKLMVQRRRARPRGLRGCAEPLRGLSRRLDAQRAFRSSNTKLSRVWLTLPPVAAALLALPGQKLNRFLAIRNVPRCLGELLHARQRSEIGGRLRDDCQSAATFHSSPQPPTRLRTTTRRGLSKSKGLFERERRATEPTRDKFFRAVVGPGTQTPSRDASHAPDASKGREPARLAILRQSHLFSNAALKAAATARRCAFEQRAVSYRTPATRRSPHG